MTEPEFESYVRSLGFENVAMDEQIEILDGLEVLEEYIQDHKLTGVIKLREIYEQLRWLDGKTHRDI